MELRQLQHFVAVAEELHFTRASQRINIVQSALSSSIRALEDELEAKLFVRTTRQVRLTAAGQVFLEKAQAVIEAAREAREAVGEVTGLRRGTLSIGAAQSLPAFLDLPEVLAAFHARHPAIEVRLCQGSSSHLLEKVRDGRLDLAIVPICAPPADVTTRLIACDALVAICAPDHALAGLPRVRLAALADEPFVDFEPSWGTRRLVDRGFAEAGIDRHIAFEVSDLGTMTELVARGLAVALVPEAIAAARQPRVAMVPIEGPEICWELVVAYVVGERDHEGLPDRAPQAFLDLLAAQAGGGRSLAGA
ncbi:LysR substrate-binding domain-containing protein [Labrys monachus]|uniref:DNA-binding transcriptional LysR family regulator n=1 Tax=Labrys monachus TaxID=217067 RepID=A0ABU0FAH3_9HYPH|nr:LysR substrate-binding domain-containing protein [Labrys monachus]MDQ0391595.1 DNA-binding transcriptional LysR family regulator [Labrys monachus]